MHNALAETIDGLYKAVRKPGKIYFPLLVFASGS
jgi:hypothetical protein